MQSQRFVSLDEVFFLFRIILEGVKVRVRRVIDKLLYGLSGKQGVLCHNVTAAVARRCRDTRTGKSEGDN